MAAHDDNADDDCGVLLSLKRREEDVIRSTCTHNNHRWNLVCIGSPCPTKSRQSLYQLNATAKHINDWMAGSRQGLGATLQGGCGLGNRQDICQCDLCRK